ncbi:MAG TPA: hypothetical protein VK501_24040 [Baekduia sp.]|nr:hypothetical protein [Baekduia sp.]HMJ36999.1 hypothetical protein [Baekduia sp.]
MSRAVEQSNRRLLCEDLVAKGVEFSEPPTERPYGIDCGLRDPFGNKLRISQMAEMPARS